MRAFLTTIVELAGLGCVTAGAYMIAPFVALIVGGLALILTGWRLG